MKKHSVEREWSEWGWGFDKFMWEKYLKNDNIVSSNEKIMLNLWKKCWKNEDKVTWNEKIMLKLNETMLHLKNKNLSFWN